MSQLNTLKKQNASPQEPTMARRLVCRLRNSIEEEFQRLPAARRLSSLREVQRMSCECSWPWRKSSRKNKKMNDSSTKFNQTTDQTDYTEKPPRRSRQYQKYLFVYMKSNRERIPTAACGSAVVLPLRGAMEATEGGAYGQWLMAYGLMLYALGFQLRVSGCLHLALSFKL